MSNAKTLQTQNVKFSIAKSARPGSGANLFAHTMAFLAHSGMLQGSAVPGKIVTEVIGARAVKWHTGQGNMVRTSAGVKLTEAGEMHFVLRNADPELVAAYESVLLQGKDNGSGVVKVPSFIHPLA